MIVSRLRPATLATCVALLFSFGAGQALAQVPDQTQAPGAAPEPVKWSGMAGLSAAVQSGVTDQRTVTVNGEVFKPSEGRGWGYSLQGDHLYSSVKIGPDFQTVANAQTVRFTSERQLTDVLYFVVRPAYKRNTIQAVDYRFEGLVGLGAQLSKSRRAQFDVLGVTGFISQDKNVDEVDGTHPAAGIVQTSQVALNKVWRMSEMVLYLRPFGAGADYRLQFQVGLTGQIVGPLALNTSFSIDRENVVLGSSANADRRFSVGVQLTF